MIFLKHRSCYSSENFLVLSPLEKIQVSHNYRKDDASLIKISNKSSFLFHTTDNPVPWGCLETQFPSIFSLPLPQACVLSSFARSVPQGTGKGRTSKTSTFPSTEWGGCCAHRLCSYSMGSDFGGTAAPHPREVWEASCLAKCSRKTLLPRKKREKMWGGWPAVRCAWCGLQGLDGLAPAAPETALLPLS